jgi:acyl-CoA dehydrogenase
MIDFELTDAQNNIKGMLHWFAESEMRPVSLQADREHQVPDELLQKTVQYGISMSALDRPAKTDQEEVKKEKKESQGNRLAVMATEELAWGDAAIMLTLPGPGLGGPPIQFMGTPAQKERFLGIFKGDGALRYGAYALTEPGAGTDVSAISTSCVKDGDHYVINGTKCFITNGARAEWNVVFATLDKSRGRDAHRVFVIEKDAPGFRVGKIEEKMGLRASQTAELVYEDCRVHQDCLLGGEEHYERKAGFKGAMKTFDATRPIVAAMAIGIARAAYERALAFARENFMLERPINRYRAIEDLLAKVKRQIEVSRLLTFRAAWLADQRQPNAKEASMCKVYAAETGQAACIAAIDVMGAAGLYHDAFVEKWFRDMKVFNIFEGTGQAQRIVIAKRILDNPPQVF